MSGYLLGAVRARIGFEAASPEEEHPAQLLGVRAVELAGVVLGLIPEILRFSNELRIVIYCIVVLFIVNFRPQGLFGETELDSRTVKRITSAAARLLQRITHSLQGQR